MADTRQHGGGARSSDARPLAEHEREILGFLLSVDIPGVEELRRQAGSARAKPWDCGCASIDLVVDQTHAPRSSITAHPAVDAQSKERNQPTKAFDLILWVEDGWLSGIELVAYGFESCAEGPDVFPPPSDFEAPWSRAS